MTARGGRPGRGTNRREQGGSDSIKLSVVIPTYQRPEWIKRAVRSLARQTVPPDEVLAVARDTDAPTHAAIAALLEEPLPFVLRKCVVSQPGFMPPVWVGFTHATGDVIAVMDDDAEALDDWAARLRGHYADEAVGAVGGRVINMLDDEREMKVGRTLRVGYVSTLGKVVGEMYMTPLFHHPMDVDHLMGGCMSFRKDVARRLEFDWELNRVVAAHYELDLGLQVRAMGLRVLFDPMIAIRHYSAPRAVTGNRVLDDATGVRWTAYNETRVILRRLPAWRSALFLFRAYAVGSRRAPGLLPWFASPLAKRLGFVTSVARAALVGRTHALLRIRSRTAASTS